MASNLLWSATWHRSRCLLIGNHNQRGDVEHLAPRTSIHARGLPS